ncbi:MAG: glycosyltransferase family 1 protein [Longimicrobiales bacterium]
MNGRFYGAPVTGVQRFARQAVAALTGRTPVTVLLPADGAATEVPPGLPLRIGALPGLAWEQVELPHQARAAGADVVLHPANSAPAWGGPHVVVLHDVTPWTHPDGFTAPYRLWSRWAHGRAARRAAAVVTVSPHAARAIAETLGLDPERVHVALQGAAPLDHPATDGSVAATRLALGLDRPYFLAVGADHRKGIDVLEGVWSGSPAAPASDLVVVGRTHPGVHVAGPSSPAAGPPGRTTAGQGSGRIRRVGAVDDATLRALYTGATALLFPSRAEGFGRPPLEALACGTRVVVAPYDPDGLLGDAVDTVPRTVEAWRGAVDRLAAEPGPVRAARIERGRARAARFGWHATATKLLDICQGVVRGVGT